MSFGEEIVRKRKELKMTQEQLAQHLGKHIKTISNWEQDKNVPDEKTRREVCRQLGIDFEKASLAYDSDLLPDEKHLLILYRSIDSEGKSVIQKLAEVLSSYQPSESKQAMATRVSTYGRAIHKMQEEKIENEKL